MKHLLIAAVLFSTPAFAAEPAAQTTQDELAAKKKTLQEYADLLESLSDEDYRDVVKGSDNPKLASRPATLSKIYNTLAGLEYRQALEAGVEEGARAEAESALRSRSDADAVAIDPQTLQQSSWDNDLRRYIAQYSNKFQVRTPTAVLAVRGGRKIPTAADKEFLKKRKKIDEAHAALSTADTAKRGGLHLSAARLWAELAEAPKDDVAAQKKRLQDYADFMESLSDEDYRDISKEAPAALASRSAALSKIYSTLAGLEYRQALDAGASDADAVAIDPQALKQTGWADDYERWVRGQRAKWEHKFSVRQGPGGGAVRGGRKIATAADLEFQKKRKKLDETQSALASADAQSQAALHLTAARLWGELAKAAAPKDDLAAKKKKLQDYADFMESLSDEDFRDLAKNSSAQLASRPATLSKIYTTLGGLEYRQALEAGVEADARAEAEEALKSRADADKVAIDPGTLQATGWWDSFTTYVNSDPPLRHRVTAVAAVRGGRKIKTASDAEAQKKRKQLEETELALASMEAKSHGALHLTAARLWDGLAISVSRPAAEAAPTPAKEPARELGTRQLYEKASPSVVLILAADKSGAGEIGTGSVIDDSGRVLTNAHVVVNDATSQPFATVKVYYKPARMTGDPKRDLSDAKIAKVLRYDRALDLALLELGDPRPVPVLALGDSSQTGPGDSVVAIGHPEQGGLWTLTQGVIGTIVAELGGVKGKEAFQTDASINRGNSGGPLINRAGEVIGVNTSMARKAPDGLTITAVNFAVKSEVARRWLGESAPARPSVQIAEAKPLPVEPPPAAAESEPAKPSAQAKILTPAKPFSAEDLIEAQMREMEDLEDEMRGEIEKRRKALETPATP